VSVSLFLFAAAGVIAVFGVHSFLSADRGRSGSSSSSSSSGNSSSSKNRSQDQKKLSKNDQRIIYKATQMAKSGDCKSGAMILEQAGLFRQAISLLEDFGQVDDAAAILLRMQRPHRAGFVYARHGKWQNAAACFKQANQHVEAGRCLREAEKYVEAAECFVAAEKFDDAAQCYIQNNDWHKAARLYLKANDRNKATSCYEKFIDLGSKSGVMPRLEEFEIDFLSTTMESARLPKFLVEALASTGKLLNILVSLIKQGDLVSAAQLYLKSNLDMTAQLMGEVTLQSNEGRHLAEVFMKVGQFRHAGMIYEQLSDFKRAGQAFERAEDFDRACYCFERAGERDDAHRLKKKLNPKLAEQPRQEEAPVLSGLETKVDASSFVAANVAAKSGNTPGAVEPTRKSTVRPSQKLGAGVFSLDLVTRNEAPQGQESDRVLFHECPIFADLDFQQREKIWQLGQIERAPEGAIIIQYQEEPKGFYLILEGEVRGSIAIDPTKPADPIDQMGVGDSFGELWLLAEKPSSATFMAAKATRLFTIDREAFKNLLDQDGFIARRVYKHFTHQLLAKMLNPSKPQDIRRAS
jgi:tetratricopeptide (TPR) repeat protein